MRLKTAEAEATIRDLRARIQELEEEQKKMREATPDHSVAHLQEELIAVRLREAEANLALKDLRHRVQELTQLWTKHVQVSGGHCQGRTLAYMKICASVLSLAQIAYIVLSR